MKLTWKKKPKPSDTVDLKPKFVCSRCGSRFVFEPEGYCPVCKHGNIVEFTKEKETTK